MKKIMKIINIKAFYFRINKKKMLRENLGFQDENKMEIFIDKLSIL